MTHDTLGTGPRTLKYSRFPDGLDGGAYDVPPTIGRLEDAMALIAEIDAEDQLLLAGLARFLEAGGLLQAHETEAAATSLFISMSAALDFIRKFLGASTGSEGTVPFDAVHSYFRRTFPHGDEVVEYFEARWEARIIAVHPASRYGEFWAPPLMVDDVYWLRKMMITLYRHIVLGEVPMD